MKPKFFIACVATALFLLLFQHTSFALKRPSKDQKIHKGRQEQIVTSEAGLRIPDWGIAIDATFNPKLDGIIPGYHIVNIVLTNQRGEPIFLKAESDKWIVVDSLGKKHTAYNHVKQFDKDVWKQMPRKLGELLDYPHVVNPGKSTTIDVFLPRNVDLFNFREVIWKSEHFNKEFSVLTTYEKSISIPPAKEFKLPQPKNKFADEVLNPEETTPQTSQTDLLVEEQGSAPEQAAENKENKPAETEGKKTIITPEGSHPQPQPQIGEVEDTANTPSTQTHGTTLEGFIRVK